MNIVSQKYPLLNDTYEVIGNQLITHQFFLWTCIVVILSSKNWKRPIVMLMIIHWALRCVGDMFVNTLELYEKDYSHNWPYSNKGFFYSYGMASIFWYSSEIIGDWYLLIRTRVLIKNPKKTRWVVVTCILYNIIKIIQMLGYPLFIPFTGTVEENYKDNRYLITKNKAIYTYNKWVCVSLQQIGSLAYDISVIIALKKNVFNKTINVKENSFLRKFKKISVYRIYLSMFVTIIGSPFIFGYSFKMMHLVNESYKLPHEKMQDFFNNNCDDRGIDSIRVLVLNFSYVFMYIDQILLRYYVEDNQSSNHSSSTGKSNSAQNSNSSFNFNMVYHNHRNYEDFEEEEDKHPITSVDINNYNNLNSYSFSNPDSIQSNGTSINHFISHPLSNDNIKYYNNFKSITTNDISNDNNNRYKSENYENLKYNNRINFYNKY
ncbi:hypothetical protein PIROE2DRAFT_5752 [Piromyces sp. E2]|nr:hypothetical protein PIROE2DRAFT_5752 [Piromyces sp. E2]|eukprot:OUM66891.1 hypothetical protein PIROE2DRAFT_5752 [Piromyces sp. E2]